MLSSSNKKIPQYKLRPDPVALTFFIITFISGLLISLYFFNAEDGSNINSQRGKISSIIFGLLSFFLLFASTAKFRFKHLWKKNASHKRHRLHTENHPIKNDEKFRSTSNK